MNYPNRKGTYSSSATTSYAHRGMSLEDDLNESNLYYLDTDRAVVYKKPTPITIVNVDYKSRATAKITEAYFQIPSTTDYNGIYRGFYIDFEAKECSSATSMPLSIIHPHQLKHLDRVTAHHGITFLVLRFTHYDETYVVHYPTFAKYIGSISSKSVKYSWFRENAVLIPYNYAVRVNYLDAIDTWIDGGLYNE